MCLLIDGAGLSEAEAARRVVDNPIARSQLPDDPQRQSHVTRLMRQYEIHSADIRQKVRKQARTPFYVEAALWECILENQRLATPEIIKIILARREVVNSPLLDAFAAFIAEEFSPKPL
jgi:hypothetical protein